MFISLKKCYEKNLLSLGGRIESSERNLDLCCYLQGKRGFYRERNSDEVLLAL
jgi:hypothetical protein